MKRLASLALFVLAGCATASMAVLIVVAFDNNPGCGADCATPDENMAVLFAIVIVLAFPLFGYLLTRGKRFTLRHTLIVLAVMIAISTLAAGSHYVWELHGLYLEAQAARPVVADSGFTDMAIATRDVQTYTNAASGAVKPAIVVPQWQRCAIGRVACGKQPRQASMKCKGGIVYVNEQDWPAFSLIPKENVFSTERVKSMHLCSPGNIQEAP